jgi:hypothetical protein
LGPPALAQVRAKLKSRADVDRQFVMAYYAVFDWRPVPFRVHREALPIPLMWQSSNDRLLVSVLLLCWCRVA